MKALVLAFVPFWILCLFIPCTPWLDLQVSNWWFHPERGFYNNAFFAWLFRYGEIYSFICAGFVGLMFLLTFRKKEWKVWRQGAIAILLTLTIGAGLITNTLLKGYWGRPRPKQIELFGGFAEYHPIYKPFLQSKTLPQKSFPSGHVAMGFSFLAYCQVGRRLKSPLLFYFGLFNAIFIGCGLMIARVAQGGHFVSDVLFSFVLMWSISFVIDYLTWEGAGRRFFSLDVDGTSQEPDGA